MPDKPLAQDLTSRAKFFQDACSGEPKRRRTRALILDTAIEIMSEKGIERTSILEIAQRAGLSNGSFYYHFRDKKELLDAVGGAMAMIMVQEVDEAISSIDNGVERVALATILFIRRAVSSPSWGGLIVHALAELGEFRQQISQGLQKDVRIGIEQGVFDISLTQPALSMLLAIVAVAIREQLASPARALDTGKQAISIILRALGVEKQEVEKISARVNFVLMHGGQMPR
jgi:AcrR family transcriptional regulator